MFGKIGNCSHKQATTDTDTAEEQVEPPGVSRRDGLALCRQWLQAPPSPRVRVTALSDPGPAIVSFRDIISCVPGDGAFSCPFPKVEARVHCR